MSFRSIARFPRKASSIVVLCVGVVLAVLAWLAVAQADARARAETQARSFNQLTAEVRTGLNYALNAVRGLRGLYVASDEVTRKDFHDFAKALELDGSAFNMRAVQFARWVPHDKKNAHEAAVRKDSSVQPGGYPQYTITPPGDRAFYVPIEFTEPLAGNERAFGLDTAIAPEGLAVFERPRDTGLATASAPIRLAQGNASMGVVIRAPVYHNNKPLTSVAERRAAYLGQVSVVFLVDDLLGKTLLEHLTEDQRVTLTDLGATDKLGPAPYTPIVLGQYGQLPDASSLLRKVALQTTVDVAGRIWQVRLDARPPNTYLQAKSLLAGALVLSLTLLVLGVMVRATEERDSAQKLASGLRENLDRSEELAAALLDATLTGIITLDAQGFIRSANPAARALFAYSEYELIGKPFAMLAPEAQGLIADIARSATLPADEELLGTTHNIIGVTQSGAQLPLAMSLSEVGHGKDHQFLASFHDMSVQKLSEDKQRAFAEALEVTVQARTAALTRVNQELEAFAYSMAHDLRAPVRHVHGFARMIELKHSGQLDAQALDYLTRIVRASDDMGRLIDDLLAFSQLNQQVLALGPVDMDRVVERCLARLDTHAAGRPIEWRISHLPLVRADESLIGHVMTNLIGNAVKFSARCNPAVIEIFADETVPGEHRICVRDNGVGLDMQYAHRLFQVFSRLHHRDEFEGTGVGLANVRRIMERHDGRAWVESTLGQGAAFWIALKA